MIKDVADFNRHIERLAQESDVIINDKGKKESSFFVTQMYKNGLSLVPYPCLANDAFFSEMHLTLKPAFEDIAVLHEGGTQFLDHLKLIMAKLNIGDWSAMSGEQAKIRAQEIRTNLQNAVEAGSIIRDKGKLCRAKCNECFYLCLLAKNHEDDEEEPNEHSYNQTNHACQEFCTYCLDDSGGKDKVNCGDKCGHAGHHNCRKQNHACGKTCSLSQYGGCCIALTPLATTRPRNHACVPQTLTFAQTSAPFQCAKTIAKCPIIKSTVSTSVFSSTVRTSAKSRFGTIPFKKSLIVVGPARAMTTTIN